jgi:hypothetical protein
MPVVAVDVKHAADYDGQTPLARPMEFRIHKIYAFESS